MNAPILKEYYMVDGTPVVMIMTDKRVGMQTWAAHRESGEMKRDYGLMLDIVRGDHDGQISENLFFAYCSANHISTEIPPRSISNSFRLAQQGQGLIKSVPTNDRLYHGSLTYSPS
ncbi:MAG: hypothetical protein JWO78_1296 [Micavibrio sp.]|nr:hypothetical protein [Micavibrio sp.]